SSDLRPRPVRRLPGDHGQPARGLDGRQRIAQGWPGGGVLIRADSRWGSARPQGPGQGAGMKVLVEALLLAALLWLLPAAAGASIREVRAGADVEVPEGSGLLRSEERRAGR